MFMSYKTVTVTKRIDHFKNTCIFLFSNHGFSELSSQYTVQQDGIYAIDFNAILTGLTTAVEVTGVVFNGLTSVATTGNTFGTTKTLTIAEMIFLQKGDIMKTRLTSTVGALNGAELTGGYSVYFVKSVREATGTCYIFIHIKSKL